MKKVVAVLLALVALGAGAAFADTVARVVFTVGTEVKSVDITGEGMKYTENDDFYTVASLDEMAEASKASLDLSLSSKDKSFTVALSKDAILSGFKEEYVMVLLSAVDSGPHLVGYAYYTTDKTKLVSQKNVENDEATVNVSEDMTFYAVVKMSGGTNYSMRFEEEVVTPNAVLTDDGESYYYTVKANVTVAKESDSDEVTGAPHAAEVAKSDSAALQTLGATDLYNGATPAPVDQETANKVGEKAAKDATNALNEMGVPVEVKSGDTYVLPMVNVSADKLYGVTFSADLSAGKGVAFVGISSSDVSAKAIVVIEDYDDYDEGDFDVELAAAEASFYTPDGQTSVADPVDGFPVAGIMNTDKEKVLVTAKFENDGEVYPVLATFDVPEQKDVPSSSVPSGTSGVTPGGSASGHSGCDMGLVSGLAVLLAALLPLRKVRR